MGIYSGGLTIGRISDSEIWGAYFREGFFFGGGGVGLIIGILRYVDSGLDCSNYKTIMF